MRPHKSQNQCAGKTHQKTPMQITRFKSRRDNMVQLILHFHIMVMGSHGLDCSVRNQRTYRDHRPRNRRRCCLRIFSLWGGISRTCAIFWCWRCTSTVESTLALLHSTLIRRILRLLFLELFVGCSLRDHVGKELEIVGV